MKHGAARGAVAGLPASLLRLHRHGLSHLLVTGGSHDERLSIARRFHQASPLSRETFLALDCAHHEGRLVRALETWLLEPGLLPSPESELVTSVLYLDPISALSHGTQRLLLMLAHRMQGSDGLPVVPGPRRLMAGDRVHVARGAHAETMCPALVDHLDKIRIELSSACRRGVA